MDERVRRHAELLVEHCTDLAAAADVIVRAPTAAEELVVALYRAIGERGARPMLSWRTPRASRAYFRAVDPDHLRTKDHELAAMEAAATPPRPATSTPKSGPPRAGRAGRCWRRGSTPGG